MTKFEKMIEEKFEGKIRTKNIHGKTYYRVADLRRATGLGGKSIKKISPDIIEKVEEEVLDSLGRNTSVISNYVNENSLILMILYSRSKGIGEYQDWILKVLLDIKDKKGDEL